MEITCYSFCGIDEENKILYVEKKVLPAKDKKVEELQMEYDKLQASARQNGYTIKDVDLIEEEDYANVNVKSI